MSGIVNRGIAAAGVVVRVVMCLVACLGVLLTGWSARAETPLERGRYLMNGVVACGNCHTPQGPDGPQAGMELAGGTPFKETAFTAYGANITPDPETGIGRWTDAQIATAIREGRRPDGSMIGPLMPIAFYRGISDADVVAIIAYLRSVPPVRHAVPKSEYHFPLAAAYGPPVGSVPAVPRTDPVAYGAYMAGPLGHCLECHTPMLPDGRRDMANAGKGGQNFTGPWGTTVGRNITSDKEHGIGAWTDAQIRTAITQGMRPDGTHLGPPMPFHYYKTVAAPDLEALIAYLRTLPPRS